MSTTHDPSELSDPIETNPADRANPDGAVDTAPAAGRGGSGDRPNWGAPVGPPADPEPQPGPRGRARRRVRMPIAAGAAAFTLLLGFGGSWFMRGTAHRPAVVTASDVSSLASRVDGAVVDITSTLGYQNGESAGTGIVLTADGEVLTNNHVIAGATSIKVTDVGNGRTYTASVVGYDVSADVAVLQLHGASGLETAKLADSSTLAVGESVVALGNAGGVGGTPSVSSGTITALNVSITASDGSGAGAEQLTGLIETNAQLEPGDSGGPLVDASGRVVGMDTAASSGSGFGVQTASGTGYAIPITEAVAIAEQIESGKSSATVHIGPTAFLGVATTASAGSGSGGSGYGGSATTSGATVAGVVSGSPAARAGIAAGDVITAVGGSTVGSASELTTLMQGHHPGDKVTVTWVDPTGTSHSATVVLATGPAA